MSRQSKKTVTSRVIFIGCVLNKSLLFSNVKQNKSHNTSVQQCTLYRLNRQPTSLIKMCHRLKSNKKINIFIFNGKLSSIVSFLLFPEYFTTFFFCMEFFTLLLILLITISISCQLAKYQIYNFLVFWGCLARNILQMISNTPRDVSYFLHFFAH